MSFPTDLEIAESANILPIKKIAEKLGIIEDDLEYYGKYKAKIPLQYIDEEKSKKAKKLSRGRNAGRSLRLAVVFSTPTIPYCM